MTVDGASGDSPVDVLLVEDNPGDVRLAREAFSAVDSQVRLTVVGDGSAALDRLLSADGEETPSLVLLDLDLPGPDGQTVLRRFKSEPSLRRTPVVVFTTSNDPADVREIYDSHANAYMTKPCDAEEYFETIQRLEEFWFSAVVLPPRCQS